jgi:hypothetical protein
MTDKFNPGDLVRLKLTLQPEDILYPENMFNYVLIVENYTNNIISPKELNCRIKDKDDKTLYAFTEDQLEII